VSRHAEQWAEDVGRQFGEVVRQGFEQSTPSAPVDTHPTRGVVDGPGEHARPTIVDGMCEIDCGQDSGHRALAGTQAAADDVGGLGHGDVDARLQTSGRGSSTVRGSSTGE
jgi:hypothetical protein